MRSAVCRLIAISFLAAWLAGCGYGQVVHSWFDHSADTQVLTGQKLPGHVYLVRGLAGDIYSLGLDQLADKITRRGVTATVYGVSESKAVADDIIHKYKSGEERGPIVLLGHSSGGDAIIAIAERLKAADIPVALAFGFDPTRIADDVPSNVDVFINLFQRNNPIGGGKATPAPGFRGRLINVDLREHTEIVHITLDKTPEVQDAVAAKIVALAAYAARQAGIPAAKRHNDSGLRPLVLKYVVPRDAPIELWDSAIEVRAKSAETVDSIASAYGVPGWAIAQINQLKSDEQIEAGRKLIIPRSLYTDAATVPLPEPRTASRSEVRPRAIAAKQPPRNQMPTATLPPPADGNVVENGNSFSDRWRSETAQ